MAGSIAGEDIPLSSAHALIKSLKSSHGSSQIPQDASTKLDLAARALSDRAIYLPNRFQIIQDWILETWNQSHSSSSALLDPAYHRLFHQTLGSTVSTIQLGPILSSFLLAANKATAIIPDDLLPLACRSFRYLANEDTAPIKHDTWVNAWSKLLEWLDRPSLPIGWLDLCHLVLVEWRLDHGDENLKKLSISLRSTLARYLSVRLLHPEIQQYDYIHIQRLLPWTALLTNDALNPILDACPLTIATFLAPLLKEYICLLQRERYRLYTQPSSSKEAVDVYLANRLRTSVKSALSASLGVVQSFKQRSTKLATHADLWLVIHRWGGYIETEPEWQELLANCSAWAQQIVQEHETDRNMALEAVIVYEEIDHQATAVGPDVIKWCLACPVDIRSSAERLLVAVANYHSLVGSLNIFFDSLDQACESMIRACDSYKSVRAVYSLIADGPLSSYGLRAALSRNVARDTNLLSLIFSRISDAHGTNGLRKDDVVAGSAMAGLRSRMLKTICNGKRALAETPSLAPITSDGKPSKRVAWARQVQKAAQLRLLNISKRDGGADVDSEGDIEDTAQEFRAEKIIHTVHQLHTKSDPELQQILACTKSNSLLVNAGLMETLGSRLHEYHWLQILANTGDSFSPSADLLEHRSFRDAVNVYVLSNPDRYQWLSLASDQTQQSIFEDRFQKDISRTAAEEHWLAQCLNTDVAVDSIVKPDILSAGWRHTVQSSLSLPLLKAFYRKAFSRHLNGTLQSALGENGLPFKDTITRLRENSLDPVCAAMSAFVRILVIEGNFNSLSADVRLRLLAALRDANTQLHAFLQSGHACSSGLLTWVLALQHSLRWAGISEDKMLVGYHLIEKDWTTSAIDASVLAVQVIQHEGVSGHEQTRLLREVVARCIIEQRKDSLREVLSGASADDLCQLLQRCLPLTTITSTRYQIHLTAEILEVDTTASREAIRDQGTVITDLVENEYILQSLRRFIVANPYVLGARDVIALMRNLAGTLLVCSRSEVFDSVIAIAIALLRHRRDSVVQQPSFLVDICRSSFPLFINRQKRPSCLSSRQAALLARFLALLGSDKESNAPILVKHLPAVLLEYVRAVADPRGRISIEVRSELKQGLAGICALVTAGGRMHSRGREGEALGDAFGLGDGAGADAERDIWADLWQGWASKRYMGQG